MKKTLALILCIALALAIMPTALAAGGTGVQTDPYLVGTGAELTTALAAGGYIKLTADIPVGDFTGYYFTIDNKIIVLDLAGFIISGHASDEDTGTAMFCVKGNGDMTVNDSSTTQTGKITLSDNGARNYSWSVGIFTILVRYGTLTVNAGTIENTGTTDVPYAIDAYAYDGDANVIINGGNIVAIKAAIRSASPIAANQATVTVNGGNVTGGSAIWIQNYANGVANVEVNGGIIKGERYNAIYADDGVPENHVESAISNIAVNDGVLVNYNASEPTVATWEANGSITISGGTVFNALGGATVALGAATNETRVSVSIKNADLSSTPVIAGAEISDNTVVTALPVANNKTDVIANSEPSYIIVIPELVDFGTLYKSMLEQTKPFYVKIEDALLEDGASVGVAVGAENDTLQMYLGGDTASSIILDYDLFNVETDGTELAASDTYVTFGQSTDDVTDLEIVNFEATKDGRVTTLPSELTRAGAYKGTMTFDCTYQIAE